jgi:predicted secreted hydrolase
VTVNPIQAKPKQKEETALEGKSNWRKRLAWLAVVISLVFALSGCTSRAQTTVSADVVEAMSAPASDNYARALEPIEFEFPRDHGPHPEYRTEWWYYTGNLTDAEGGVYGYQLTFFRSALTPAMPQRTSALASNQIYMAHFALTDGVRGEHESFERFSRGAGGLAGASGEDGFAVWVEDWSATELEPDVVQLRAAADGAAGTVAIDLTLRETRPPVLQGDRGLDQKGPEPGNASYYYSLTGLDTSGTITSAGQPIAVTGISWMDHEFGTSALSADAVGWDWFSIQLDNGAVLMLYSIRTADGASAKMKGTLAWPDGSQQSLASEDFTLEPVGEWTSPRTNITYPSGWQIALGGENARLTLTPLIPDQEMDVSFVYWEGAIDVEGEWGGEPVRGRGYVELTGYGEGSGGYQR